MSEPKVQPFGHRIIGRKKFDELAKQAETTKKTNVFGTRMLDKRGAPAPAASYSQKDVAALLKTNPADLDRLFAAETKRVEGPRKAVLRQFRVVEANKPTPRQPFLDEIDGLLDPEGTAQAREEAAEKARAEAAGDDEEPGDDPAEKIPGQEDA